MRLRGPLIAGLALLAATAAVAKPFPWGAKDKAPSVAGVTSHGSGVPPLGSIHRSSPVAGVDSLKINVPSGASDDAF